MKRDEPRDALGAAQLAVLVALSGCALFGGGEQPKNTPGTIPPGNRTGFWEARGVTARCWVEDPVVVLGEIVPVQVTIQNIGPRDLSIIGERSVGFWPFSSTESAKVSQEVSREVFSYTGRKLDYDSRFVEHATDLEVKTGTEVTFTVRVDLESLRGAEAVLYEVGIVLFPLGISFAGEAERFMPLPRCSCLLLGIPADSGGARELFASEDWDLFRGILSRGGGLVLPAALHFAQLDAPRTVEELIGSLSGRIGANRGRWTMALQYITGMDLGVDVERWLAWWGSDDGILWKHRLRVRAREEASPREEPAGSAP